MLYNNFSRLLAGFALIFALGLPCFATILPKTTLTSGSIVVDAKNTKLFYTDSRAPKTPYTTVFLLHGMSFNGAIFSKVSELAGSSGLRIVAINRRDYKSSTPYSSAERNVITNGTDAQRREFMRTRGVELAIFVDKFMQQNNIPLPATRGSTGSVAIVGWSAGTIMALSVIASVDALPRDVQARLGARIQNVIMQEPPVENLGFPSHPHNWTPLIDTSIPPETRIPMTALWVSSYFKQGDLSTRNPDVITWVVPSIVHPPTTFTFTSSQFDAIVEPGSGSTTDFNLLIFLAPQLHEVYRAAVFNTSIRAAFPKMKTSLFTGDASGGFAPYGLFLVQDDNDAAGGNFVTFQIIPGANHFIHWDNPKEALSVYSGLIRG